MNIGVVGLGLIGGSLCKAIKAYTHHSVWGEDRDEAVLSSALEFGAIDGRLDGRALAGCDLVLSALYPADTIAYVRTHLDLFQPGCILLDVCGVKGVVCRGIREVIAGRDLVFIGGHPMAGREFSGFAVSDQDLFQGASMILTPDADLDRDVLRRVSDFILSLGFGRVINTTPEFHDRMIAYTSQLPHVIASSYVKSPNCRFQLGFTGGSFEDMSRVAKLNEGMWTELFLDNPDHLVEEIDTLVENLKEIRNAIDRRDAERLRSLLAQGRVIKESLNNDNDKDR